MLNLLADHLWQSTLFGVVAALVAFLLRNGPARARYTVWLAASLKFVVPCVALAALGNRFGWRTETPISPAVMALVEAVGQPFSAESSDLLVDLPAVAASVEQTAGGRDFWPLAALALWVSGAAVVGVRWLCAWRALRTTVRESVLVTEGRDAELLRQKIEEIGVPPVALRVTDACIEPGVFGIWRPVLLWPRSIGARLDDAQIAAIFTHELAHVKRRDNLSALLHMLVRAIFWFHPLVAWIDARLMHERESACDEEVVRAGSEPQAYAEGLLKACAFCVESSVACVAGVTGADLQRRVATIMRASAPPPIARWQRALVILLACAMGAGPLALGMMAASPRQELVVPLPVIAPPDGFGHARFAVASIKRSGGDATKNVQLFFKPDGQFTAINVTLRMLLSAAYGERTPLQPFQLTGGPEWMSAERFNITARAEGQQLPATGGPPPMMFAMLRNLLAERFGVQIHREVRETDVDALVRARPGAPLGPALKRSTVDCAALAAKTPMPAPMSGLQVPQCAARIGPGRLVVRALSLAQIAQRDFPRMTGRMVIDRTGLEGGYDLDLEWAPKTVHMTIKRFPGTPEASGHGESPNPERVSFAAALEDQLGLKLVPARATVDYFVVERAALPTPDEHQK